MDTIVTFTDYVSLYERNSDLLLLCDTPDQVGISLMLTAYYRECGDPVCEMLAQQLLAAAIDRIQNVPHTLSLYQGITGLAFSLSYAASSIEKCRDAFESLDTHIGGQIARTFLTSMERAVEGEYFLHPLVTNLSDGVSGLIAYYAHVYEFHGTGEKYLSQCARALASYLNRFCLLPGDIRLPGWFTPQAQSLENSQSHIYPNGSFSLSHAYGCSGYLAALVTYLELFPNDTHVLDAARFVAKWLVIEAEREGTLPIVASYEDVVSHTYSRHVKRDTWFCGIPVLALTLYRFGLLDGDNALCERALELYLSLFEKDKKEWNMIATSLFHGRAGMLLTTYRMASLARHSTLERHVDALRRDLVRYRDISHPFLFQAVEMFPDGRSEWQDDPGLLFGAAGIFLTLDTVEGTITQPWDRILLTI